MNKKIFLFKKITNFDKKLKMNSKKILFLIIAVMLVYSCNNSEKNINTINNNQKKDLLAYDKAKEVLYSLPSPVETAMIIENANTKFDDDYLLPIDNINFYETSYSQATILGVYSADLSYISMFEQQQLAVKYLSNCKKLAESLGVMEVINDSIIDDLSKSIKRKEEVLEIISNEYMKINSYLEDNNRQQLAALLVFGGWIEGLYISTKLVNNDISINPDLVQTIYDQKLSLEDLINLMKIFEDNPTFKTYTTYLLELNEIFNSIKTPMGQKDFDLLQTKILTIRTNIVKNSNNN